MKKFIQVSAILSLLFVFAAVSAFAQSSKEFQAKIPFDFNIGQNSYKSGNYVIKIARSTANGLTMTLIDSEGKSLETMIVTNTGEVIKNTPRLVFNIYGNQRFLSQIQSEDLGISIGVSKTEKIAAEKSKADEKQAVLLKK